ncbi:Immunity protein 22 [Pseudomonas sp. NFACC02]|uniref:immunity 22 family protein n=1 Tax=Pseudomonas sp. NFACC02 TaxID=1566250 RepID=UPI0008B56C67|nr:immunity 22 family protein [Pseudomonas sp. NFACC02]SEQ23781.1 Immunity protein 22 [Pseudomonas sp. NFACC02]
MDPYDIERYEKVHIWVGTNFDSEADYSKYFELDHSAELDEPAYQVCGFCKDLGIRWYDEDFIGIIPRSAKEVELDEILYESAIDPSELKSVKAECEKLGIKRANAIFWYSDGGISIPHPYKATCNGLIYIGLFQGN